MFFIRIYNVSLFIMSIILMVKWFGYFLEIFVIMISSLLNKVLDYEYCNYGIWIKIRFK